MNNLQASALDWAFHQPSAIAFVLLLAGLLFCLQGFRFVRFLMPLTCAAGGFVVGLVIGTYAGLPVYLCGVGGAALLGIAAMCNLILGLQIGAAMVFALLGHYFSERFAFDGTTMLGVMGFGAVVGFCLRWICFRQMGIIVTTVQGAMLLTLAFVAGTSQIVPGLTLTFIDWSNHISVMGPVFLLMLFVLGYTVQSNALQGDITSGGARANYIT